MMNELITELMNITVFIIWLGVACWFGLWTGNKMIQLFNFQKVLIIYIWHQREFELWRKTTKERKPPYVSDDEDMRSKL